MGKSKDQSRKTRHVGCPRCKAKTIVIEEFSTTTEDRRPRFLCHECSHRWTSGSHGGDHTATAERYMKETRIPMPAYDPERQCMRCGAMVHENTLNRCPACHEIVCKQYCGGQVRGVCYECDEKGKK